MTVRSKPSWRKAMTKAWCARYTQKLALTRRALPAVKDAARRAEEAVSHQRRAGGHALHEGLEHRAVPEGHEHRPAEGHGKAQHQRRYIPPEPLPPRGPGAHDVAEQRVAERRPAHVQRILRRYAAEPRERRPEPEERPADAEHRPEEHRPVELPLRRPPHERAQHRQRGVEQQQDLQVVEVQVVVKAQRLAHGVPEPARLQPAREEVRARDVVHVIEPGPDQQAYQHAQEVAPEDVTPREPPLRREHQRARAHEEHRHRKAREAVPERTREPREAACLKEAQAVARGVYYYDARAGRELYYVGRQRAPLHLGHLPSPLFPEQMSPMYIHATGTTRHSPSPKRLCTR